MPQSDEIRQHVDAALAAAREWGGAVSGPSAALSLGWDCLTVPPLPHITVARGRHVRDIDRRAVALRRMDLPLADIDDHVTVPARTLVDCARRLSFAEALVITDAALRRGFRRAELDRTAAHAKGPGSIKVRRVARHADGRAANVFESALRAICLTVTGLHVRAQMTIGGEYPLGTPDLVDVELRLVIEADSFERHGHRSALVADAGRYNGFVTEGWLVLRFTWEDVMLRPDLVREVLVRAVAVARATRGRWVD